MNLLLVSPRLTFQKGDFLGSGVPYWPVELAVTAAFLQEKGHSVTVADLFGENPKNLEEKNDHYLQGVSFNQWLKETPIDTPSLIIVFAISYMSHKEILNIITIAKNCFNNTPVVVLENSQAVTAYSLEQLKSEFFSYGADGLICGEIYWNLNEILSAITDNSAPVPSNLILSNNSNHPVKRLTNKYPSYPYPAWELFNIENYWSLPYCHGPRLHKKFFPIFTSRGCPYPCDFCVVPETNMRLWRARSAEEVVGEMLYLKEKFNVKYFQIEDLNPTVKGKRWLEIANLLIKKETGIEFAFVSGTKAETVKIKDVPLLAKGGCRYISISPESGSQKVMKTINKPFDYQHALELVSACKQYNIATQACFLVGHPDETEEDFQQSKDYLKKLVKAGLDETAIFIVSPVAGSKIYKNNKIKLKDASSLPSFSPKGRENWKEYEKRRKSLIKAFFIEKLKLGAPLFLQGFRSLFGNPKTKMENLPKRVLFIYYLLFTCRLKNLFFSKKDLQRQSVTNKTINKDFNHNNDKLVNS